MFGHSSADLNHALYIMSSLVCIKYIVLGEMLTNG